MPSATIGARGVERLRAGHPWIYRSDVTGVEAAAGDLVEVVARGRVLGHALFSDRSEITLRVVAHGPHPPPDDFVRERLAAALRFRESLQLDATAYRLVHGEADRLPSLIVDRYGEYLVLQALSQGIDRRLPEITRAAGCSTRSATTAASRSRSRPGANRCSRWISRRMPSRAFAPMRPPTASRTSRRAR
jgi:23S rRNA (cytosine1962-C5)-methyltransferase